MEQIKLIGFEKKEIINISGSGISFKKIRIPNENCSNFIIIYEIINPINNSKYSSPIHCLPSIYQRDVSQVTLYESVLVPDNCILNIQIESTIKQAFSGTVFIDYEIFPTTDIKNKSGIKVFISENDRQNAFRIALINLARFFNIPNWEYLDNQTLYETLISLNNTVVKLLKDYFKAYNAWFEFYVKIKKIESKSGTVHSLTTPEEEELSALIQNRESTLNALQKEFDKLQFEKFKIEHGLEDVGGIGL
jgi:hypothetical protein